jgi:hypothetical protein
MTRSNLKCTIQSDFSKLTIFMMEAVYFDFQIWYLEIIA